MSGPLDAAIKYLSDRVKEIDFHFPCGPECWGKGTKEERLSMQSAIRVLEYEQSFRGVCELADAIPDNENT